jgi:hypothetical protein
MAKAENCGAYAVMGKSANSLAKNSSDQVRMAGHSSIAPFTMSGWAGSRM